MHALMGQGNNRTQKEGSVVCMLKDIHTYVDKAKPHKQ